MCEKVPFFEILQRMREGIEMNSHPKDPGEEVLLLATQGRSILKSLFWDAGRLHTSP